MANQIERDWMIEVERRYRSYLAGKSKAIPAKQAIAAARTALRSKTPIGSKKEVDNRG